MKKVLLLGVVLFVSICLNAHKCREYIDLSGTGIHNKEWIKNPLLAQAITLSLNADLSPDLPDFPVDGTEFVMMVVDCMIPEAGGISGNKEVILRVYPNDKGYYLIRIQTEAGFVNERFGVQ